MTALAEVATYLPAQQAPIEAVLTGLGVTPMQAKVFRRYHDLAEVRLDPGADLLDLLLAAATRLTGLAGREPSVRYVVYARSFPVVVPYPVNPLHDLCRKLGLSNAIAFAVSQHACASGLLALDLAGRLLAAEPDPEALALVVAGEKAFTPDARFVPETTVFSEGASAALVTAHGARDRMIAYATNGRGDFDDELSDDPTQFPREYHNCLAETIHAALTQAGLRLDQLDLILPQNINTLVWRRLCRRIGFPVERVLLDNIPVFGHVYCADAFLNYQTAQARGLLRPGTRYLVGAAGAGMGATFSAMIFEH